MSQDGNLYVGVARLELQIPDARSLKDRRRAVRPLVERLRNRHRVLVLETGRGDLHQRAGLAICAASTVAADAEQRLERVRATVDDSWPGIILDWSVDLIQL